MKEISEYCRGRKAWLNKEMSWSKADNESPEFQRGYRAASNEFPNHRPKIIVGSQLQMQKDRSTVSCANCDWSGNIEIVLIDHQCPECGEEFPIEFNSKSR
jgi:predicted RNA-binding Zn-ribbon protein involved in translation (DUF1610 family)